MLRTLTTTMFIFVLAGCHSGNRQKQTEITPSCQRYQLMMTAPMPEEAMQRLKIECDRSK